MVFDRLNSYSSVLVIRDFVKDNRSSKTQAQVRASVKIAIIDDEKFQAFNNLTSYGYSITELPDIRSVVEVQGFDIILCDLMGVGANFDKKIGGASIIKEIKTNYPTKFVVAYSGARSNSVEALAAKEYADAFLKKDADLTSWVDELDEFIDAAIDPYEMWLIARQGLIDQEIDLKKIIKLEDAYVRSVLKRDAKFSRMSKVINNIDLNGNAKSIIQSLIASSIYAFLFAV